MMNDAIIVQAKRTAIGKANRGLLKDTRPDVFASLLLKKMLSKTEIPLKDFKDIAVGCAFPEGEQGFNVARVISQFSGLPDEVAGVTVNRFCASGLEAIKNIAHSISLNQIDVGIAGGVESMSAVPMGGYKFSAASELVENNPDVYINMGITAENIAKKFNISREEQDKHALESHQRSCLAIKSNFFAEEIEALNVTVYDKHNKKTVVFNVDEGPRYNSSIESLEKLRPSFKTVGTVTAGNSSQLSDGAAFVFMTNQSYAKKHNLDCMGYFRDFTVVGVPSNLMGIGPVSAIKTLLKRNKLSINDIGVFEINEAFSSQYIYCIKELGIDKNKVNPLGGAIALGHPLGCTGTRQVVTLLHEMKRKNIRYGISSMCVGGGMGAAALIENYIE